MIAKMLRRGSSGVAVVETAAVISFTLLVIFGMIQLVLIGYYQVAGDAATFMYAHEYTLGVQPSTIANVEASMVPAAIATNVTVTAAPPPSINASPITTMYGTINQNDRTGGYTLVRPQNLQAYLSNATYGGIIPFKNIPITSGAVEGYYLMTNDVMDNSGLGPNDTGALAGNVLNAANASPFLPNSNLANNMNVPPYYAPNAYWQFCTDPWTYQTNGNPSAFGDQCNNPQFWGPGLAEFLDNNNYGDTSVGVDAGGTFAAMAVHQRVYADLIAAFPALTSQFQLEDIQLQFNNYNASNTTGHVNGTNTTVNFGKQTANPALSNGCTGTGSCGANWTWANDSAFNGIAGTPQKLAYYDPLNFWVTNQNDANGNYIPGWLAFATSMWSNEAIITMDSGNDAPGGPWLNGSTVTSISTGVSVATVYAWDQPHGSPTATLGTYFTNPLGGGEVSGDPAY